MTRTLYWRCDACGDRARYANGTRCVRPTTEQELRAVEAYARYLDDEERRVSELLAASLERHGQERTATLTPAAPPGAAPFAPRAAAPRAPVLRVVSFPDPSR